MSIPSPSLMTPQTIARIRAMAATCNASKIAGDLGWDAARVLRAAKLHNIAVRDVVDQLAVVVNSHPILDKPAPLPVPRPLKLPAFNSVSTLPDICAALPNVHVRVLRMLEARGDFISCDFIADCTGMTRDTVKRCLPQIESVLAGTRWCIERKARRNGGFRLVEVGK